jgi:hypothetical protein
MAAPARAQVPDQQGFFGHIDGRWMWLGGDKITSSAGTAPITDGPGGQMLIGYKLDPHWDVALAGDVQGLLGTLTKFQNGTLSVDTNHQHFDLELGYSSGWWRVNAGLRGIHYKQGGTTTCRASSATTSARCTASASRRASAPACRSPTAGRSSAAPTRRCSTPTTPRPAAAC